MAEYSNQFNIQVAEMVRLTFNDSKDGALTKVAEIICHFEALKLFNELLTKTIIEHSEKMEQSKQTNQTNKSLS